MKLSKRAIGMRTQDFHESLRDYTTFGPREAHMKATMRVGKTASLAMHLKGLNYVENVEALACLAAELGITGLELDVILQEMEELDFASVVKLGDRIKRIELRVPELRDGYENLGERWQILKPGEIEQAAVQALEEVAAFPRTEASLKADLGLDPRGFDTVLAISTTGALLERVESAGSEPILYSPLTVEEKPDAVLKLAEKFPQARVITALQEVQSQQGKPIEKMRLTEPEVVGEAVLLGVLCPVRITTTGTNEKVFLFTPRGGLTREEKIILEKARAILACVRYGEHYATNRRILYPRRILETLRDQKRFSRPRTDFPEQYGLLVTKQIGYVEKDKLKPDFYHFHLHDTPENLRALDIAIDLLSLGTASPSRLAVDTREFLDVAGSFGGTLPTRARLSRGSPRSKASSRMIVEEVSKLARGVIVR